MIFLEHQRNRITRDFELAVSELDSLAEGKDDSRQPKFATVVEA